MAGSPLARPGLSASFSLVRRAAVLGAAFQGARRAARRRRRSAASVVIGGVFGDHRSMTTLRLLLLCALAAVGACHRDSDAPAAPAHAPLVSAPVVKKGPGADQLTAGMVEAASQGKSQLPVRQIG